MLLITIVDSLSRSFSFFGFNFVPRECYLMMYDLLQMSDRPTGDPALGAKIFKQRCAQCHTTEKVRINDLCLLRAET